ncbi:MAG: elongation factor Ts [Gammaproteobacteria bacterium]|nr:elongation factor Ts [Gammaproteobacteria bacterium]MCP5458820.1 elongation factor Ts [Gammaproteobacteria bacterium]
MADITAALVKELREQTGVGMMECKKALQETDGDLDAAVELMRKTGQAKAAKKAGRVAAEGAVTVRHAADGKTVAMVEVNSETDFVSKRQEFQDFAAAVADLVLARRPADMAELLSLPLEGDHSVDQVRQDLVAKIGENIQVRRFSLNSTEQGILNSYVHHGGRIGAVVELEGGDAELAKDIAMHVAASKPLCVSADQVPAELLDKEREIYTAQAADSGKPANIVAKMVDGRIGKYLKEITLLGQPFVKDPERSIEQLANAAKARIVSFERFELGEGLEKKSDNFADEVMAQIRGG